MTEARGLTEATLDHFKVGVVVEPDGADHDKGGYISIPYLSAFDICTGIRFRNKPEAFGPKYTAPAGQESGIFNVAEVAKGKSWIIVTEGEIDAMTLWQCGLPVVGIPGANSWKDYYYTIFEGFERVIICGDSDGKGDVQEEGSAPKGSAKFIKAVTESVDNPVVFKFPDGYDVNGYYKEYGEDGIKEFLRVK